MKRLLSSILILILIMSAIPIYAASVDSYEGVFGNDSIDTAYDASAQDDINFYAIISKKSDVDYYKIFVSCRTRIKLKLTEPSEVNYDLSLYNSKNVIIASSANKRGVTDSINKELYPGYYYVKISSSNNKSSNRDAVDQWYSETARYNLNITKNDFMLENKKIPNGGYWEVDLDHSYVPDGSPYIKRIEYLNTGQSDNVYNMSKDSKDEQRQSLSNARVRRTDRCIKAIHLYNPQTGNEEIYFEPWSTYPYADETGNTTGDVGLSTRSKCSYYGKIYSN